MSNVNTSTLVSFIKEAKTLGLDEHQALLLFKSANQDPGAALAPPPAPGAPVGGQGGDEMAQLEQLLQSLPPEQQEQAIQQILAELQGGGQPQGGAPHSGHGHGGAPQQEMPPEAVMKQSAYQEAFLARGAEYGYDFDTINSVYKYACAQVEETQVQQTKVAEYQSTDRLDGFVKRAAELGYSKEEATQIYRQQFGV